MSAARLPALVWIAIALAAAALVNLALSHALGLPLGDSSLNYVRRVALGHVGDDSWAAMSFAWDYWLAHGRERLYEESLDGGVKYIYPPVAMLVVPALRALEELSPVLGPFAILRWTGWAGLLVIWYVTVRISMREGSVAAPPPAGSPDARAAAPTLIAAGAVATLLFYPLTWGFNLGQVQTWISTLLGLALLGYASGRATLAGALVGACCLLKPHLGLLLLWGILARDFRFAVAGFSVAAAGALVSLTAFGLHLHLDYVDLLRELSQRGESYYQNHSFNGLLNRLISVDDPTRYANSENFYNFPPYDSLVHVGTLASSAALLAAALLHGWRHGATLTSFALAITLIVIASPLAWQHHYGVMLPIGAWTLARTRLQSRRLALLSFVGIVLIGMYAPAVRTLAPSYLNVLQSYALIGGLLIAISLAGLARAQARARTAAQPRRFTPTSSSWA